MEEHSSKQDVVRYFSVPPLESMAVVSIVVQLWRQPEIKREIQQHMEYLYSCVGDITDERDKSFRRIKENISEKLSRLLPESLKRKAADIIHPIGIQIVKWMDFNHREGYSYYAIEKYINYDCWTMHGTIDKTKTLELYTNDVEYAYCTSCTYCLEHDIKTLWEQMPQEDKNNSFFNQDMYRSYKYHLVAYWTCSIKKESDKLLSLSDPSGIYSSNCSIYKNMLMLSLRQGNVTAGKYFWHKLTYGEIYSNVTEWTEKIVRDIKINEWYTYEKTEGYANVLCFLLSQMDEEQQREVFRQHSEVILNSLLHNWPWQKYLIPTIVVMWNFLQDGVYVDLLEQMICEIKINKITVNVLNQLWYYSPMKFRKCFIAHMVNGNRGLDVIWNLFEIEDVAAIKVIVNDANTEEKKKIISLALTCSELCTLIFRGKLSSLEMLIRETLSSECEITDFKKNVMNEHGSELCRYWLRCSNWSTFETFISWSLVSEEDMKKFKEEKINKVEIFSSLVCAGDYELVNKFMNWCFSSDEEINQFKKCVAFGDGCRCAHGIIKKLSSQEDLTLFPKFINYCFSSDEEINNFKESFTKRVMKKLMFNIIVYSYNFEFATEFLTWRFASSSKEIDNFKRELLVSSRGINTFYRFITDHRAYMRSCTKLYLVKQLTKWFYPFTKEVVEEFPKYFECFSFNLSEASIDHLKALFCFLNSLSEDYRSDCTSSDDSDTTDDEMDDDTSIETEIARILSQIMTDIDYTDTVSSSSEDENDLR